MTSEYQVKYFRETHILDLPPLYCIEWLRFIRMKISIDKIIIVL